MADKLNLYKGDDLITSAERSEDGTATVTIDGLDANTDYTKGTYKVSFENENGESDKTDVPAFKTKAIRVTNVTVTPETLELNVGDTSTVEHTVAPSTASNKAVDYTTSNADVATVNASGEVTAVASGTANIEVTTKDGNKKATVSVTVAEIEPEPDPEPDAPEGVSVESNEDNADVSAE